jgi:Short C-terminal domain
VIVGGHHPNRDLGQPFSEAYVTGNDTKGFSMGFRRRVRRRALVGGAIAGGAIAHHRAKSAAEEQQGYDQAPADDQAPAQEPEQAAYAPPPADPADEIEHLAKLHESGALTDEEFAAGKAKILGT